MLKSICRDLVRNHWCQKRKTKNSSVEHQKLWGMFCGNDYKKEDSGLKNFKQKKIINEIKIESRKKQRKRVRNSIKKHKIIQYTINPIKEKKDEMKQKKLNKKSIKINLKKIRFSYNSSHLFLATILYAFLIPRFLIFSL